jgi:hypothetical protein
MLAFVALNALAVPPLDLQVDPKALSVELICATQTLTAPVKDGHAIFTAAPTDCKVALTMPIGTIPGPGFYTCNNSGCVVLDAPHGPTTNAANRVNVILREDYSGWLEITCEDGYRTRADIHDHVATFEAVKDPSCVLMFKGAAPAQFRHIEPGTWTCGLTGTTAICTKD